MSLRSTVELSVVASRVLLLSFVLVFPFLLFLPVLLLSCFVRSCSTSKHERSVCKYSENPRVRTHFALQNGFLTSGGRVLTGKCRLSRFLIRLINFCEGDTWLLRLGKKKKVDWRLVLKYAVQYLFKTQLYHYRVHINVA